MKITLETLVVCQEESKKLIDGECVHVFKDGSIGHGTLFCQTNPSGNEGDDIVYTFHPERAPDPWDCFVKIDWPYGPSREREKRLWADLQEAIDAIASAELVPIEDIQAIENYIIEIAPNAKIGWQAEVR